MPRTADPPKKRSRRRWWIAVAGVFLLTASGARIWLYQEEPPERFEVQVPEDVTFHYATKLQTEDGWQWAEIPEVPPETGRAILDLLDGSERCVVDGEWVVRLDHWPPMDKVYPTVSPPPPNATLQVRSSGTEEPVLWIDFVGSDNSGFVWIGMYDIPEENLPALRALLDDLDAACRAAHDQEVAAKDE